MAQIKITYGTESVVMSWDGAQASAPILADGDSTPYQTADARHRTALAVALVCRTVWPEVEWPRVPLTGSVPDDWSEGCEAWDDISYEPVQS